MLKIGEFSKLSHLTVKALRFYEKKGILMPAATDEWTGYRFYNSKQLDDAAKIRTYRRLGLSIKEIRQILSGSDERKILLQKYELLCDEKIEMENRLSEIKSILEGKEMKYRVCEKIIPEKTVYISETVLDRYSDIMEWIPSVGEECMRLNPGLECAEPPYEFCEFSDCEYKESNIKVRHIEAVTKFGNESERIKFAVLPEAKVLSIFHKGPYVKIPEAYAFLIKYAENNGYKIAGPARECYIDGIWNKESEDDWLTELQLPIE